MTKIEVFGPGCSKCTTTYELIQAVLEEKGADIPLEKVTDPMEFAARGVLATPAVAIDGKIVLSGRVPSREEIGTLLEEHGLGENKESCDCGEGCACGDEVQGKKDSSSCCCGKGETQHAASLHGNETIACCNKGGCAPCCGSPIKRIITWVLITIVIVAVIKLINKNNNGKDAPAPTHAAAVAPIPTQPHIEIVYYLIGPDCKKCEDMRSWIEELVSDSYSGEVASGALKHEIKKATPADVEAYELEFKTVVIKVMKDGKEADHIVLYDIFDHATDGTTFKAYISQGIKRAQDKLK